MAICTYCLEFGDVGRLAPFAFEASAPAGVELESLTLFCCSGARKSVFCLDMNLKLRPDLCGPTYIVELAFGSVPGTRHGYLKRLNGDAFGVCSANLFAILGLANLDAVNSLVKCLE